MSPLNVGWKLVRAVFHAVRGLLIIMLLFPRLTPLQRGRRVQVWSLKLLEYLGVELVVHGQPPVAGPMLLVANHISWLDIVVMHAVRHCRFVSKSDVRRWPLIGVLATAAGTLYIERESRRDAMRVVHHMARALSAGEVLAVFPEGTTGDGVELLPFHANLIQAAITAQAPVQPLALHFRDPVTGLQSQAPSYLGDETLIGSIWRTLSAQGLVAVVSFGEPQRSNGRTRRTWATDMRSAIVALLQASR
ncbi:MAG: lysophospholipid acyltransferase family protein [Rhodoferax sp.]